MKAKKPKKPKSAKLYDDEGNWVEERGRLKGAIRRAYRLHPGVKATLDAARVELPPKTLKDGSVGKKNQVRYRCAQCQELFSAKNVQVDHIKTVVPLDTSEAELPFDKWVAMVARGVFCKNDNLQVLCSTKKKDLPPGKTSCHGQKSNRENFIRDQFQDLKNNQISSVYKDLVDKTFDEKVAFFSKMYDSYVVHKEEERLAKEKRKLERLSKKKTK